jgi:L-iditol 2-dehydrogenase
MDFMSGAMIEPLAVAVHAVRRFSEGIEGKKVVVLGAGPIGNLVAQAAKGLGAAEVMITDVSDYRLALASRCGIDHTANTRNVDFNTAMVEKYGPDKADVIYDCAGNNITMNQAIRCARKGSTIILVAVFADMGNVDLAVLNDHELDLNTSMMYRHDDYLKAIELVNDGKINLKELQSKVFSFGQFKEAYEFIDANRETTMKVLINVQDQEGIVVE